MVDFVKSLDDIQGKTVERAQFFDCDGSLILIFTDNSALIISGSVDHDGIIELCVDDEMGMFDKRALGLITQEEFQEWRKEQHKKTAEQNKKMELEELARLKAKYE